MNAMLSIDPAGEARGTTRDDDARWEEFRASLSVLRNRLRGNGASDLVLADLLEDDLRQARIAVGEVAGFLDGALATVGETWSSPAEMVDAANTSAAMDAVSHLEELLPAVRRRLGQVALRFTRRPSGL